MCRYDEQGRLLGWDTTQEPEWLPEDVELALAHQAYRASICPGCGHPRDEAWDPDNADAYTAHRLKCGSCAEKDHAFAKLRDPERSRADSDGIHVITTLDDEPEPD